MKEKDVKTRVLAVNDEFILRCIQNNNFNNRNKNTLTQLLTVIYFNNYLYK